MWNDLPGRENEWVKKPLITLDKINERLNISELVWEEQHLLNLLLASLNTVLQSGNIDLAETMNDGLRLTMLASWVERMPWWHQVIMEEFSQAIISLRAQKIIGSLGDWVYWIKAEVLDRLPL